MEDLDWLIPSEMVDTDKSLFIYFLSFLGQKRTLLFNLSKAKNPGLARPSVMCRDAGAIQYDTIQYDTI